MPLRNLFRKLFRQSSAQETTGPRPDAARPDEASGGPLNVKAGDLARVVGDPAHPCCLVAVREPAPEFDCPAVRRPAWRCELLSSIVDHLGRRGFPGDTAVISDDRLRPLPGDENEGVDEILQRVGLPTFPVERQGA